MNPKIALALSLATTLFSQDVKSTISEVLSSNPIVQERLKNYNATKEDITAAKAGYLPKLDLSVGVGKEDGERAPNNIPFDYNVYQNSLTLTQNVFKGFETQSRVAQHENRTLAAAYNYIEKVNNLSFETLNAYVDLMKHQELLALQKENIGIHTEIFKKVQKLYDAGLTTLSEVNKIESALALANANYVVQENTLLGVSHTMQKILGHTLDAQSMVKPANDVLLPATVEEATEIATKNNPSLLVSQYNIQLAHATYEEKKSPLYPSLDLELSQSYNKNLSGVEGRYENLRAMAYLRYNLFNGFADKAGMQKSVSTIHQEMEIRNRLQREVIERLNLAWTANEKLAQQLKYLNEHKKFSLQTLTLYSKEYDLGRRSLLDLLSAQNDFMGAKTQIINSEYSLLFAKYRVLDAMGTLVTTIVQESDTIYSKVGLRGETPPNSDKLPISYNK
ncbi:TolC family outer membrane protein [Sulfurimonas sp.]|uniref:TolC family outer membrane protein n=1 Tax=Sulfurimonas sp. TaxID=2022749 RepID=UPI00263693CA|nr:TolC family outer membrane protein [Sulfurimonas sp.]MDD3451223.1 TolC family outer membrane protein [Sulfurimonas sp.]